MRQSGFVSSSVGMQRAHVKGDNLNGTSSIEDAVSATPAIACHCGTLGGLPALTAYARVTLID